MPMIEIDKLTKKYGDHLALDHLTLGIQGGEIFSLLGANGAGKTTTINLLLNFVEPTSGAARISGLDVVRDAKEVKRPTGWRRARRRLSCCCRRPDWRSFSR